jgi:hypothetical protein
VQNARDLRILQEAGCPHEALDVAAYRILSYHEFVRMHMLVGTRFSIPMRIVMVAGLLTIGQGCASSREARSPVDGPSTRSTRGSEDPIVIEVQNLNFNDVSIWTVRSGQRIRLGRVTGKTDKTFRIGWNVAVPIRFDIDVTGGRSCATANVAVDPNAFVWVSIPSSVGPQPCRVGRR